jgi:5-oxoprolinase (ATP-hydrolysing)
MPREVLVGDVRIRAVGKSKAGTAVTVPAEEMRHGTFASASEKAIQMVKDVYFEGLGWRKTPVYLLGSLRVRDQVKGPAMIIDDTQTILVAPNATATVLTQHVVIDMASQNVDRSLSGPVLDPIQLSVFGHRFMGIAEQMGRTLQKTSVSTNIKERLDFSCALFSEDGRLVANGKRSHRSRRQEADFSKLLMSPSIWVACSMQYCGNMSTGKAG